MTSFVIGDFVKLKPTFIKEAESLPDVGDLTGIFIITSVITEDRFMVFKVPSRDIGFAVEAREIQPLFETQSESCNCSARDLLWIGHKCRKGSQ